MSERKDKESSTGSLGPVPPAPRTQAGAELPAVAYDDEELKARPEDWAGPDGQPSDTERPMAGEEDSHLRSHHLEATGGQRDECHRQAKKN